MLPTISLRVVRHSSEERCWESRSDAAEDVVRTPATMTLPYLAAQRHAKCSIVAERGVWSMWPSALMGRKAHDRGAARFDQTW